MRKWYMVAFCLITAFGILAMLGCEGDAGQPGNQGLVGPPGDSGIDLTKLQPADRPIGVGLTNSSFNGVEGVKSLWLTFNEAARGRPDTLAASRLENPPLIDGIDGTEAEWGEKQSRVRLAFLNPDPNVLDPTIYDLVARAGYDDENVYFFFSWKEINITVRTEDGRDTTLVDAIPSRAVRELFFDNTAQIIDDIDTLQEGGGGQDLITDTTFFKWVRIDTVSADTLICIDSIPSTPEFDSLCVLANVVADSSLLWRSWREGEDRLVVFFNGAEDPVANWLDLAFAEFFDFPGGANLPAGYDVDVWAWGSGTSDPVYIADDWHITSSGKRPDLGAPPYLDNYVLPDSTPRFMHFRDPNYKTELNLDTDLFPFWYYDAVGYSFSGWQKNRGCFVAGYVTTIPSGSRADVYAASTFESATGWVLELKRARRTNNGDDVVF